MICDHIGKLFQALFDMSNRGVESIARWEWFCHRRIDKVCISRSAFLIDDLLFIDRFVKLLLGNQAIIEMHWGAIADLHCLA